MKSQVVSSFARNDLLVDALDLERRHIWVDGLIKFARREVTSEHGLRDDVGRFGVADEAKGVEPAIRKGRLKFAIKRIVRDSLGDEDKRVGGESRLGGGEGVFEGNRLVGEGSENVVRDECHAEAEQVDF